MKIKSSTGKVEDMVHSSFEVTENTFGRGPMGSSGSMKMLAKLIEWVCNLGSSECTILQSTNGTTVFTNIRERIPRLWWQFSTKNTQSLIWFSTDHTGARKKIPKRSKIFQGKFGLKSLDERGQKKNAMSPCQHKCYEPLSTQYRQHIQGRKYEHLIYDKWTKRYP